MSDEKDKVMDVEGLAKYLSLSKSTVYKLAQEGALPGQKVGKHWRFRRETVNNWLDEERPPKETSTPEPEKPTKSQGGGKTGQSDDPPLSDVFSPEQVERLKERWIETTDQVLAIAATPRGSSGLTQLLDLSEEEFAGKLKVLQAVRGVSTAPLGSPEPGGELGVIIEDIPYKSNRESNGE